MKLSKELAKGSNGLMVLSVIEKGDKYGYLIVKEIALLSDGTFEMNEGTLYPILHSLEQEELAEAYWVESESGRKRKYYRITEKGKRELAAQKQEWKSYSVSMSKVLGFV